MISMIIIQNSEGIQWGLWKGLFPVHLDVKNKIITACFMLTKSKEGIFAIV
jgi:hypothetical protein